jgi:hypothetical protein
MSLESWRLASAGLGRPVRHTTSYHGDYHGVITLMSRDAFLAHNEQIKARENHSLKSLKQRVNFLELQLAEEIERRALLESLLHEGISSQYFDVTNCSPVWLEECRQVTKR